MCSEMSLDALLAELQRREIVLQMDGPKLIAIDPYQRLSPALKASIQTQRDALMATLKPVSAALRALQSEIDNAMVGKDLDSTIEAVDSAFVQGKITQEEAEALAQAATEKSRQIPASVEEMPLAEFASSGLVKKVKSKQLGETVIWAADNAQVPPETDQVVYQASELKELAGMSPEQLRKIHMLKKTRDWEVVNFDDGDEFQKIPAEQLLDPQTFGPGKICWACKKNNWRDNGGRLVCAICHPQPDYIQC